MWCIAWLARSWRFYSSSFRIEDQPASHSGFFNSHHHFRWFKWRSLWAEGVQPGWNEEGMNSLYDPDKTSWCRWIHFLGLILGKLVYASVIHVMGPMATLMISLKCISLSSFKEGPLIISFSLIKRDIRVWITSTRLWELKRLFHSPQSSNVEDLNGTAEPYRD